GESYDRILVACDPRVVDVATEYQFSPLTASKVVYTGFVAPEISPERDTVRTLRGLPPSSSWVVCSAGGGTQSEEFLKQCVRIAREMPDVAFDVVFGPRSDISLSCLDP